MKLNKFFNSIFLSLFILTSCGPTTPSLISSNTSGIAPLPANFLGKTFASSGSYSTNSMNITVNGSTCGSVLMGANTPCASVTICSINNPTICQTIDGILIDTGSYGLRIFNSVIQSDIAMSPVTSGSNSLAECVTYGDSTSNWGPVEYVYVQLAGEPKVAVPIQVIDFSYRTPASPCNSQNSIPNSTPGNSGYNGILGLGLWAQDCGFVCTSQISNGIYYTCNDFSCAAGATVALEAQVTNPVSALPTDNNGISITLPSVSTGGVTSLTGNLTLGIGGTAYSHSSTPTASITLKVDGNGEFFVNAGSSYNSATRISGIIDSGSSYIYFNPTTSQTSLTACSGEFAGLYCSSGTFTETNTSYCAGSNCSPSATTSFDVVNANTYSNSTNSVFSDIAGTLPGAMGTQMFDWGLPFFMGKTVYVEIEGKQSTLGTGPFFAY